MESKNTYLQRFLQPAQGQCRIPGATKIYDAMKANSCRLILSLITDKQPFTLTLLSLECRHYMQLVHDYET